MYSKVIGALSLAALSQAASDKCRVLALGSGDESVAYQVGVIKALVATGDAEYQYDAISGVEAAAVNAVLFGSYAKDDQDAAAARLEKFWIDASNADLYSQWFGGFITGMLSKGGFYDSSPLKTFLDGEFADFGSLQRDIDFGIVDLNSGDYVRFQNDNLSADNVSDALFASMTVAGYFPPAKVFDHEYISGSAYWDLDIYDSVLKCKAMGFDESDIIVDTIMTSSANEITDVDADGYKSIRMLMRYNSISSYYNSYDGYTRAKFAFKDATFRHLFQPSENLHDSDKPFHMSQKEMEHMIDVGVKDATQELSNPVDIKDQMFYYYLKKTGDSRITGYSYGEFLEGQKVGAFGEYDVYSDPYARKYVNKLTEEQKIKFLAF